MVDRLIGWQWPDGGWNCDKRVGAARSSFQESLIPARGLWAYGTAHAYRPALEAAQRAADLVLPRRLLWHRRDGSLIVPEWAGRPGPDRIDYPIQFFDVLFALQVMADLGRLGDPRRPRRAALRLHRLSRLAQSRSRPVRRCWIRLDSTVPPRRADSVTNSHEGYLEV